MTVVLCWSDDGEISLVELFAKEEDERSICKDSRRADEELLLTTRPPAVTIASKTNMVPVQ